MAIHYRTLGLIIKRENRGEADQVFTIYTADFGKLEILGKAIRKIKSKLRGGIELFYLSEIEFIQGKIFKTLTDAILINRFPLLRSELERLKTAYKIAELSDRILEGEEQDEKIWELLNDVFQKLNNLQTAVSNLQFAYYYFLWNLLSILGYQPELYRCSVCQQKLSPVKLYFVPEEGGLICASCFRLNTQNIAGGLERQQKEKGLIHSDVVKILRLIMGRDWETLSKLKLETYHQKALKNISQDFLSVIPSWKDNC